MTKTNAPVRFAGALLLAAVLIAQQKPDSAETQLQAAVKKEVVDGDLSGAIAAYQKILAANATNHRIAAETLLHLGLCYEKLGDHQARQAWERLVRDYPDQAEPAAAAKARLAANAESLNSALRRVPALDFPDGGWCLSPDGRYAAGAEGYQDESDLAVVEVATGRKRLLSHGSSQTAGVENCFFTADGRQIVYDWWAKESGDEVRIVNKDGSGERVVFRRPEGMWVESLGGPYLAIVMDHQKPQRRIALVSIADGSVRDLLHLTFEMVGMRLSPDGRWLAVERPVQEKYPQRGIFLVATADGRETPLDLPGNNRLASWTSNGNSLLVTTDKDVSTDLYSIRLEGGHMSGRPVLLRRNLGKVYEGPYVTGDGGLYFSTRREDAGNIFIAALNPDTGAVSSPTLATHHNLNLNRFPDWSHDGTKLTFMTNLPFGGVPLSDERLGILDVSTGSVREIQPRDLYFGLNRWRPDGGAVLVQGQTAPFVQGVFLVDPKTGSSKPVATVDPAERPVVYFEGANWTPDGKSIIYARGGAIIERNVAAEQTRELRKIKDLTGSSLALSPDGTRIAFLTGGGANYNQGHGGDTLWVMPLTGGEPRAILHLENGERFEIPRGLAWLANGNRILFSKNISKTKARQLRAALWSIPADGGQPVDTGLRLDGLLTQKPDEAHIEHLSVNPAGNRIAFSVGPYNAHEGWVLEGLFK